ncbi:RNA-binding protein [Candidatus Roizmanbacteria bacterium]|nr:RNA-binding protein [Candidatus Roizmanbacteria bacterium]
MDKKKLFVGNLPWSIASDTLKDLFSQYGEIVEAIVITDRMSGRSKGFGFVTFADEAAAEQAIAEMHEKDVDGRAIVVNVAKPREERSDRGGFRRDNNRFRRDDRNDF